jgi:hypothetical protein
LAGPLYLRLLRPPLRGLRFGATGAQIVSGKAGGRQGWSLGFAGAGVVAFIPLVVVLYFLVPRPVEWLPPLDPDEQHWLLALAVVASLSLVGAAVELIGGLRVSGASLRVPRTDVASAREGLVELEGRVEAADQVLTSPFQQAECVYYRYQRAHPGARDEYQEVVVPFRLRDATGSVRVDPRERAPLSTNHEVRDSRQGERTTEETLRLGDSVYVLGWLGRPVPGDGEAEVEPVVSPSSPLADAFVPFLYAGGTGSTLLRGTARWITFALFEAATAVVTLALAVGWVGGTIGFRFHAAGGAFLGGLAASGLASWLGWRASLAVLRRLFRSEQGERSGQLS